jgi:hypothetical protein
MTEQLMDVVGTKCTTVVPTTVATVLRMLRMMRKMPAAVGMVTTKTLTFAVKES